MLCGSDTSACRHQRCHTFFRFLSLAKAFRRASSRAPALADLYAGSSCGFFLACAACCPANHF